ncbi:TetR/AcrR family transcriptional regulator [Corynebacterium suedekumii]|uniref:Helix-turn-helix domain-containing protein n=1 Tax=Corynebacterium suedekumii TaxID=3049801 RepID=A0ABY8VPT0_9CORY|nr:TetR/AcrR family transcriptional regulator [Corynebacterium suedekumii]WIM70795.1 helix-turn-helix domain-containing protein [Corynebacterium suedekumii]
MKEGYVSPRRQHRPNARHHVRDTMKKPLTREEKQLQTRELLIDSARTVFSRDGYHAARLEVIATEAGFTKGAVYSNFSGKPELFLAVIDANLDISLDNPDMTVVNAYHGRYPLPPETQKLIDTAQGFALATLEFTAAAARDSELRPQITARLSRQLDSYTRDAAKSRSDDDPLTAEELGFFLSALEQGTSIHILAGGIPVDHSAYTEVVERITRRA